MTSFATITPTRGDRPELLEFCKYQLSRMSVRPDKSYFIDYKPTSERIDLVERVKQGVEQAKNDGYEYVFIVEDDDAYGKDYFAQFDIGEYAFYGSEETIYYNIRNATYNIMTHPGRSSLFTTGFKISELQNFNWYAPRSRFLDITIWEYSDSSIGRRQFVKTGAIGIKHNLGLCAGKGHLQYGPNTDYALEKLRAWTDDEQFQFYSDLMKRL